MEHAKLVQVAQRAAFAAHNFEKSNNSYQEGMLVAFTYVFDRLTPEEQDAWMSAVAEAKAKGFAGWTRAKSTVPVAPR